ncbi:glycoside hydrolase family 43 protein, partial [Aureobasidium melanogenum]
QDDGSFIMYYSATAAARPDGSKHCVGAATSPTILGPYTGLADALFCPLSRGGAIDASGFKDRNGKRYVVYKVDGNSIGHGGACGNTVAPIVGTPLMLQPVAADGHTFTGNAVALLDNDGAADQGILEAPVLTRSRAGVYFLFFSSGCFATSGYTVSYATATNLTGPYTRASSPLFRTGDGNGLKAPGGMSVWGDNRHMVLHANYGGGRAMYTTLIALRGTEVITT